MAYISGDGFSVNPNLHMYIEIYQDVILNDHFDKCKYFLDMQIEQVHILSEFLIWQMVIKNCQHVQFEG